MTSDALHASGIQQHTATGCSMHGFCFLTWHWLSAEQMICNTAQPLFMIGFVRSDKNEVGIILISH